MRLAARRHAFHTSRPTLRGSAGSLTSFRTPRSKRAFPGAAELYGEKRSGGLSWEVEADIRRPRRTTLLHHKGGAMNSLTLLALGLATTSLARQHFEVRGDLHFPLEARGTNTDGSVPLYKNPKATVESRVNDLLPRMTVEEKVSQM